MTFFAIRSVKNSKEHFLLPRCVCVTTQKGVIGILSYNIKFSGEASARKTIVERITVGILDIQKIFN